MVQSEARRVPKSLLWQCQGVERRCLLFELKGGTVTLASVGAGNAHQWRSVAGYIQSTSFFSLPHKWIHGSHVLTISGPKMKTKNIARSKAVLSNFPFQQNLNWQKQRFARGRVQHTVRIIFCSVD